MHDSVHALALPVEDQQRQTLSSRLRRQGALIHNALSQANNSKELYDEPLLLCAGGTLYNQRP